MIDLLEAVQQCFLDMLLRKVDWLLGDLVACLVPLPGGDSTHHELLPYKVTVGVPKKTLKKGSQKSGTSYLSL